MQGCPLVSKLTTRVENGVVLKTVVLLDIEIIKTPENARGHPSTLRELNY